MFKLFRNDFSNLVLENGSYCYVFKLRPSIEFRDQGSMGSIGVEPDDVINKNYLKIKILYVKYIKHVNINKGIFIYI